MKIIAIANQKGGVGKTTTTVNLGAALAERAQRILLIDLDPQGNATSSLGMQDFEGESLYDPLLGETVIADKILPTRLDHLFLVPADLDLAGAEVEIARMPDHLLRLARTLRPLRADSAFDFVLLDCPPSLGILMSNALAAADEILTPIQCEYFALEGLVKIVRVVEQVRDSGANPNIQIGGILMTMFDSRTNLSAQVVAEVALKRGTEFRQNHFGIRQERGRRARLPYFGGGIHSAPHPSCSHRCRVIAKTNVGKPLKVVSLSRIIPFFAPLGAMGDFRDESKR